MRRYWSKRLHKNAYSTVAGLDETAQQRESAGIPVAGLVEAGLWVYADNGQAESPALRGYVVCRPLSI